MAHIERGTPEFRRTNLALFAAGFATFALIYCVQPLMPEFARAFHLGAAVSSLSLSVTTGLLAVAMLLVGALSEAWGRKPLMVASLLSSALLTMISALVPSWRALLLLRAVEGITFAGLPALAMAYLGEEMHVGSIGLAMGLYIGGTALGGMAGRLLTAVITDFVSWRVAIASIGVLGVGAALIFWRSLPASRQFHPRPLVMRPLLRSYRDHLRDGGLLVLFTEAFLFMGSFVAVYNYIAFRLLAPPYLYSQSVVGFIFVVYLVGIVSSAWIGALALRVGRETTLRACIALMLVGVAITLARPIALVILGIVVLTFGFFGAHSVASSWVGVRAQHAKAQASSLYLFFYYLGSSVIGAVGGTFWTRWGWVGVAAFVGALLGIALLLAARLRDADVRQPTISRPTVGASV